MVAHIGTLEPQVNDRRFDVDTNDDGLIVDVLSKKLLQNKPEERVRQRFLKVLHYEYGYPYNEMRTEVTVYAGSSPILNRDGSPKFADIVVYSTKKAASSNDQSNIKFMVECKRPNVTQGLNQLASYVFNTSAEGAIWTNGDDLQAYRRTFHPSNGLLESVGIPARGETWESMGRTRKSDLRRPQDVRGLLRLCNNKLHGRGIDSDEEDLTMEMVRIILAKAQDEMQPGELPEFYVTSEENASAEGRVRVAQRIQRLFRAFADNNPGVFSEYEKIGVSDRAITDVVALLQHWQIMTRLDEAQEWDVMGAAYEEYTHTHLKRARGQFFTNRLVVDMMVKMLDPIPGSKVLDPAGGSGGFTTAALRHMRQTVIASTREGSAQREHQLANLRRQLFAVEISKRLVKISKTAMLLNGDGHSGMTQGDSLGPFDQMDTWIQSQCNEGQAGYILTNPPFAGVGDGQVTDREVLAQFQSAHRWKIVDGQYQAFPELQEACPPEMLFFERCLQWLKVGGKLAIIVPKSFLDTATFRPAREVLFAQAKLLAVINLHKNSFQPDTGVRTAVLIVEKTGMDSRLNTDIQPDVFMAISQKVGRDSEGVPIYKILANGERTDILDEDLSQIFSDYTDFLSGTFKESEYRFAVPFERILESGNINPQHYLPDLNETLRRIQSFDERDGWSVSSLSQVASDVEIFKGPRLRTENILVEGPGAGIEPYYTPSAILQDRRDSVKWLDMTRATDRQRDAFDVVRVHVGDILVTRSGSIGRVAYITSGLDGAIVSDDAIRVRIPDVQMRLYVLAFLLSDEAQAQMRISEYGAVQQHLEPSHLADLSVPIPDDMRQVREVVAAANSFVQAKEFVDQAHAELIDANDLFSR
ncbi:N-6 DNA methylase [Rothia sp. P5764]|uniref:N-6 DNA methylase n=1 Tax=Rothia sp. P5764 TaxID=3402654 RepID=UPI003ABE3A90